MVQRDGEDGLRNGGDVRLRAAEASECRDRSESEEEQGGEMQELEEGRRRIRRRADNAGSDRRTRKLSLRMTERLSNELASIQGLMLAHGKRETLAELWERVAMPAIREYVAPYAAAAKAARK